MITLINFLICHLPMLTKTNRSNAHLGTGMSIKLFNSDSSIQIIQDNLNGYLIYKYNPIPGLDSSTSSSTRINRIRINEYK